MMKKVYVAWDPCCDQRWRDYRHIKDIYLPENRIESVEKVENADYALIITCAFSEDAQNRSINLIETCKQYLDEKHIVILGCLPESAPHLLLENESIKLPPKKFDNLDEILIQAGITKDIISPFSKLRFKGLSYQDSKEIYDQTWLLSLGEGCSLGKCAYCVKSKSCGIMQSVLLNDITKEFVIGLEKGYRTFRFVGEDIAAYGKDIGTNFPRMLNHLLDKALSRCENAYFNTFMNGANPEFLYQYLDELLSVYSRRDCIIDGMQLSIQSFNQRLIELCNRPGNTINWINMIKKIKEIQPTMEIWAQIIVGLPTETEEELSNELNILCSLPVEVFHFYGYSHVRGNRFFQNHNYNSLESDVAFEKFLSLINKFGLKIANKNGKSIIVTRFDKMAKNPRNNNYHAYRGIS